MLVSKRITGSLATVRRGAERNTRGACAPQIFTNRDEFHLGRDDALTGVVELSHSAAIAGPQWLALQFRISNVECRMISVTSVRVRTSNFGLRTSVPLCRLGVRNGQVSIVDRRDRAPGGLFHIAAVANPFCPQCRQAFRYIDMLIGIAPRAARVVNADRLIHLDLAAHRFRRRERDLAEWDAEIGMLLAGDVDLAGVG